MRLLLLLLPLLVTGLKMVPVRSTTARLQLSRRGFLATLPLAVLAVPAVAVEDDDDFGSGEDEIPDVGRPTTKKGKKGDYSPADGAAAFKDIVAARKALDRAEGMIKSNDWAGVNDLLGAAPVSTFENSALVLVQSKALKNPEDIKAIGTIKRYGVGADAIIMLGGLGEAASKKDSGGAASFLQKAKASLDEIIIIGKSNGLALS